MVGELSPLHWMVVAVVFMVLFGAKRMPDAARGLGRSLRILKAELGADATTPAASATAPVTTAAPANTSPPLTYTAPTVVPPSAAEHAPVAHPVTTTPPTATTV